MNVLVRLVLLAGAAAALSLMVREPLAMRVAARVAPPVHELSALAVHAAPRAKALPIVASSPQPIVTLLPPVSSSPAPRAAIAPTAKKPAPKTTLPAAPRTITRKQLEDAIATRVGGARASLVRDESGAPVGLRLSGVSMLAPFGVQDGDVLVSANGMSLRTPDEALAALGKLQNATHVTVVLRRGAASYAVTVDFVE